MAPPAKIMIIRHAEEPQIQGWPPFGVQADGVRAQHGESLTVRGWQRAGALAVLFGPAISTLRDSRLAVPHRIYAENTPTRDETKWHCALETIMPLAERLGLTVNMFFAEGDEQALAADVLSRQDDVLIAWDDIRTLVRHLTCAININPIPEEWPWHRCDLVWVFTAPASSTERWGFDQVPQMLLAGDANSIISASDP
jgi:hypothetical protein